MATSSNSPETMAAAATMLVMPDWRTSEPGGLAGGES